jgi:hypothetical protein
MLDRSRTPAMLLISTDSEFAAILEAGRALIFLDFEWSGQSKLSAAVIQEWERTSNIWGLDCPVFRVRPDDLGPVVEWISGHKKQLAGEGGYGSLVWLRAGTIIDYEPYVVAAGLRDISRRTQAAFRKDRPSPSPSDLWDRELDG